MLFNGWAHTDIRKRKIAVEGLSSEATAHLKGMKILFCLSEIQYSFEFLVVFQVLWFDFTLFL